MVSYDTFIVLLICNFSFREEWDDPRTWNVKSVRDGSLGEGQTKEPLHGNIKT